jgi:hypothetical protein
MKLKVTQTFIDKNTKKRYEVGDIFETDDNERVKELRSHVGESEKSVLDHNVSETIELITNETSHVELKILLDEETNGKDRKTVKEHIESLLKGDDHDQSGAV